MSSGSETMKVPGTSADGRPLSQDTIWRNPAMPTEINPNDPYNRDHLRDPIRSDIGDLRSPAQIDDDLQVDPELAEGPASSSRIALFAVGIAVVLGLVFYGLNNSSTNQQNAATAPAPATAQNTNSSPPPAPPGMRDVTPRAPNSGPGTTTGAAPANPQAPAKQ
jgi:hypothetical protein